MDCWEQLDARGIQAEVIEVVDGEHRAISL
jgi:hypothetical protein